MIESLIFLQGYAFKRDTGKSELLPKRVARVSKEIKTV